MVKSRSMVTRARLNKCEAARKSTVRKLKTAEKKVKKDRRRKSPAKQSKRRSPKKTTAKKRKYKKMGMSKVRHAPHSYFATVSPKKAGRINRKYKSEMRRSKSGSFANKRRYKKQSKAPTVKKVKAGSSQDVKKQMRSEMANRANRKNVEMVTKYGSGKGGNTGDMS